MINWTKHGFVEDSEYKGLFSYKPMSKFPFSLSERNGFITIFSDGLEYKYSEGTIPATDENVALLLKAFHVIR